MSTYTMNEAVFDLPTNWRDQSINVFVVGGPEPPMDLSLVISRDVLKEGVDLVDHVEKQIVEIGKKLQKFRVIGKRQIEVAGRPALEAELTWVSDGMPMHQRQQYIPNDRRVLVFTATAPIKIADEHNAQIDELLGSLIFRE